MELHPSDAKTEWARFLPGFWVSTTDAGKSEGCNPDSKVGGKKRLKNCQIWREKTGSEIGGTAKRDPEAAPFRPSPMA